jgi:murein tripeptide amidase MpaA
MPQAGGILLKSLLGLLVALLWPPSGIGVLTNFEGGSVGKVEQVSDTHLRCAVQGQSDQDHRNRQADWYYFELTNLPDQPITLDLVDLAGEYNYKGPAYSVTRGTRPAYSYDGADWRHFSDDQVSWDDREPHLTLHFTPERDHLWIAHVEPYTHKHLAALLDSFRKSPYFKEQSVGRTVDGRGMPLLTITNPQIPEAKKKVIWLMFRQHAWESGSSWVGDGTVRFLLSKDVHAACIRDRVIYKIFPLADPDGVADGGVRFNRNGYDLNRNWDTVDAQKMPEIAAQRRAIFDWVDSGHRLDLFLSLHNTEEIEYLETPAPFNALGERVYRVLAETTSFHPTAALREMATATTPGGPGRMTVDQGLFHDRQLPAMLLEQMIEYNSKLGRVPTLEDRREFGAELVRALAAAVTERDSTDAAPPQDVRKALEGTTPFERPENIIEQQYL